VPPNLKPADTVSSRQAFSSVAQTQRFLRRPFRSVRSLAN
jgi:hypothetical protein